MSAGKSHLQRTFRFAEFELSERDGELRKNGLRIRLQEQPFQVLSELLANAGNVVTREQLQQKVWPADTFVDFDVGLNTAIRKIRHALDDDADHPRYIETAAKRGYRFLGPVKAQNEPSAQQAAAIPHEPDLPPPSQSQKLRRYVALAAAASGALVLLAWFVVATLRPRHGGAAGAASIRSVAILPFTNLSGDPNQEYFADGMTDALIANLSKIGPSLRVISRTSAMHYKETNKKLPEIAKELNVDGVVEGSVVRSGNRVRVTVQLIEARQDWHLWAESYERDLGDVLKLQNELALAIAQQVHAQLSLEQKARLDSPPGVNAEAYEAFAKGRFYLTTNSDTQQGVKQAQSYFEQAIQKDPDFALAYVGLADCYQFLGGFRWLPPKDSYQRAKEAIDKALRLDATLGEAHNALAWGIWLYEWDWQAAEREFKYAVELAPNYVEGHFYMALYLSWSGRRAEALAEIAKIHELDPAYFRFVNGESAVYYHLRDYKAMVEEGQLFVSSNPSDWLGHYFLGVGYEGLGKPLEAIPEYQKAVELSKGDQDPTAALAHAYATVGKRAQAEQIVRELRRKSKTDYVSSYMIATIYSGLNDKDKAFEFLEKAYQERSGDLPYFLRADLRIDSLRSDPRFREIWNRVGLPQ